MEQNAAVAEPLTDRTVPSLDASQLTEFTYDNIHTSWVGEFYPSDAITSLSGREGQEVIAIDLGGDKLTIATMDVRQARLNTVARRTLQGVDGAGYLEELERVAEEAANTDTPVGISFAGPIEGTHPIGGPNVLTFLAKLEGRYSGDFAKMFPTLASFNNDAVAGMEAAAVEAKRDVPEAQNIIYLINGSGLGGALLLEGSLVATEVGHVRIAESLNRYGRSKACGMFDAKYTCIEAVAANKAGVEATWLQQTGEDLSGKQIEELYREGNQLAGELYDHSALVTAHSIEGLAEIFGLLKEEGDTVIVGHGGTFKFPAYGERVQQILAKHVGFRPTILLTKDFSDNACLDGAAISALSKN